MYFDVIIAGFGGQGVMFMGNVLATAAMDAGKYVTYMPVYGVEMRGGTANCTVVLSDNPIGSPIVNNPFCLVAMNKPSAKKFASRIKKEGFIIANSNLVDRKDLEDSFSEILMIPILELAQEVGNSRLGNMIMLGVLTYLNNLVDVNQIIDSLPRALSEKYHKMIPINSKALECGADYIKQVTRN